MIGFIMLEHCSLTKKIRKMQIFQAIYYANISQNGVKLSKMNSNIFTFVFQN